MNSCPVPSCDGLRVAHLNINSLRYKVDQVCQFLSDHRIDILGLTETHLCNDFNDNELHIPHFRIFRKDRTEFGGGVALYAKEHLKVTRFCELDCNGIEQISVKVQLKEEVVLHHLLCLSPSFRKGGFLVILGVFLGQFAVIKVYSGGRFQC